jgi:hypothetical protein
MQKVYLQPTGGDEPDLIVVDDTVIQLHDDHFWLYTVVDSRRIDCYAPSSLWREIK